VLFRGWVIDARFHFTSIQVPETSLLDSRMRRVRRPRAASGRSAPSGQVGQGSRVSLTRNAGGACSRSLDSGTLWSTTAVQFMQATGCRPPASRLARRTLLGPDCDRRASFRKYNTLVWATVVTCRLRCCVVAFGSAPSNRPMNRISPICGAFNLIDAGFVGLGDSGTQGPHCCGKLPGARRWNGMRTAGDALSICRLKTEAGWSAQLFSTQRVAGQTRQ